MSSREEFEAWVVGRKVVKKHGAKIIQCMDGSYSDYRINDRWLAWQASRESMVVDLPDPFWPGYVEEDEPGLCISTNLFTIEQITQVLTGYGIRTK